jgi:hypothetical protein
MAIRDLKLDEIVSDIKQEAQKRASGLIGEGRAQARELVGGHSDGTVLTALAIGLVLGAVVGAAIALLATPFSGNEARRRIGERVDRMRSGEAQPAEWRSGDGTPASAAYAGASYPGGTEPR